MSKLTFLDKLKVLIDVISSSALLSITVLLLIASLFYIFITTNKKNAKSSRRTYIVGYLIVTVIVIAIYGSSISKLFDYMMNNLFVVIYFPNLAVYFAAIIITNIILLVSIFNFKISKTIKYINTIVYSVIHYLLILIINIITTKKLDVFTQSSVYENKQALALIELSSIIFVTWIIFLTIYKLIRIYQTRNKVEVKQKQKKSIVNKKRLPDFAREIEAPRVASSISKKHQQEIKNKQAAAKKELELIKKQEEQKQLEEFDKLFTLEDYKKMLDILKTEKNKKEEKKENIEEPILIEQEEQKKLTELQDLYKSVR